MLLAIGFMEEIARLNEQIAKGETPVVEPGGLDKARNVSRVPRKLPQTHTRMQLLERDLYWDMFCTHKRYFPPPSNTDAKGRYKRCSASTCVTIRREYQEELAQIYEQLPPF